MTWTAAEAAALATLLTPDYLPSQWYEYRHGVARYVPLVTGHMAPFNAKQAGEIYSKYGAFTTAASMIASWAVIHATFGKQA